MMGDVMTEAGEGERQEARRRRMFWMSIGALFIAGMVLGFFTGITAAIENVEIDEIWTRIPQSLAVGVIVVSLAMFIYGCWRFYKAIDEVEMLDNLWGSAASYYLYATLFPVWWALGKANLLPEPSDWGIYFAALGAGGLVYLWRKWRAR